MSIQTFKFDAEKVFDVYCHMNSKESRGTPYTKFKQPLQSLEQQDAFVKRSLQCFIHGIKEVSAEKHVIQAFSGTDALPELTKDVFDVTLQTPNYDVSWQETFKTIPLRKGQLSWEIADVSNLISFELVPEGAQVTVAGVTGSKASVDANKYGAALGVTWETIEGRKLYQFVERLEAVRDKLYKLWADSHHLVINTAAAAHGVAWQGSSGWSQIDRDIATLNQAAFTIADACKNLGFGDTANARFLLYISPKYKARMLAAINATQADIMRAGGEGSPLTWMIEPRFTFNGNITADKGNLVLPGFKFQNAIYMRELGLEEDDVLSLGKIRSYWTAFGAACGDDDQAAQISLA